MSRQPQSSPAQRRESIGKLPELEAASAALRNQFLAGFRQMCADSAANFHKEMAYWPTTKRLMRMDPQKKFWIVTDDVVQIRWMLDVFVRSLDDLSAKLANPRKMETFINGLGLMRPHIDWVEREARKIWPLLRKECLLWAQVACDGKAEGRGWRAPGWLDKWPDKLADKGLLSAARVECLDADGTTSVLKEIAKRIKDRIAPVQKSALDNLRVRLFLEETARQAANTAPKDPGSYPGSWTDSVSDVALRSAPYAEFHAKGLYRDRETARGIQRFLKPGSREWRQSQKKIDAIDRELSERGKPATRKPKKVRRRRGRVSKKYDRKVPQRSSARTAQAVDVAPANRKAAVDAFIDVVTDATGRRIKRKEIWAAAGYNDATEFQRFQRGDARTTKRATAAFNRVLKMSPEDFLKLLNNRAK